MKKLTKICPKMDGDKVKCLARLGVKLLTSFAVKYLASLDVK